MLELNKMCLIETALNKAAFIYISFIVYNIINFIKDFWSYNSFFVFLMELKPIRILYFILIFETFVCFSNIVY